MFTIKVSPQSRPFDVVALAAKQYKKEMSPMGYNLWYQPYESPEGVWSGVGLFLGDTAYVENAAGKTIDKIEGFEVRSGQQYVTGSSIGYQPYESHFHLDDTAYLATGDKVKISGVLFSEGKVHYHLEGSVRAWDSCDLFDAPPQSEAQALSTLNAGPFTQRTPTLVVTADDAEGSLAAQVAKMAVPQ